jgi:chorismate synthase
LVNDCRRRQGGDARLRMPGKEKDMTSSAPESAKQPTSGTPLAQAVEKNKEATEEVHKAAEDLAVAHAVLDTKAAKGAVDDEAKRAVAETAKVEKRLSRSAEKLQQVNETLQREIKKRR